MSRIFKSTFLGASLLALVFSIPAYADSDKDSINQFLTGMFGKPDNPLKFGPIIVAGDNAVADWYQGDTGGRALLWRKDGKWALRLCSGDSLKKADMLTSNGIDAKVAEQLTENLAKEEAKVEPTILAKFSLFQGTMVMDKAQ